MSTSLSGRQCLRRRGGSIPRNRLNSGLQCTHVCTHMYTISIARYGGIGLQSEYPRDRGRRILASLVSYAATATNKWVPCAPAPWSHFQARNDAEKQPRGLTRGRREGLMTESVDCSPRESSLLAQVPSLTPMLGGLQPPGTPAPGDLIPLASVSTYMCIYLPHYLLTSPHRAPHTSFEPSHTHPMSMNIHACTHTHI